MPIQKFKPMCKDFATFDCDAHIVEPAKIWERAEETLSKDELEALKTTMWFDAQTQQLVVNGKADVCSFSPVPKVDPGVIDFVRLAGPGLKHDIQRALNARNLNPETALTPEQSEYLAHAGADEPRPRLREKISGTLARSQLQQGNMLPDWYIRKPISALILEELKNGNEVFVA